MPYKNKEDKEKQSKIYYFFNKTKIQEYNKEYHKNHPREKTEKELEYNREYRRLHPIPAEDAKRHRITRKLSDPIGHILAQCKKYAKRKHLDFNLEREDIIIPEFCPVLGISLFFDPRGGKYGRANPHTPSPDRVDNTKGYVKGNVKIISKQANEYKSDMSKEDIGKLYEYVSNP